MARIARAIVPGLPHHITQRGNRRQPTFFRADDYSRYLELMSECCSRCAVDVWAYCLMPNHVHLIAVPPSAESLRRAIGEAHRLYTAEVNKREGWTGYLWQGRFSSFVMDERHTLAAARYIELNPVRAGLVARAEDHPWSSARAHLFGVPDSMLLGESPFDQVTDWAAFLRKEPVEKVGELLRKHRSTGRPLGNDGFVQLVEKELGRSFRMRKPGPVPRRRVEEIGMVSPDLSGASMLQSREGVDQRTSSI